MEPKEKLFEPLLERMEEYSKTSFELLKLKSVDKTTDLLSGAISRLLLILVLSFFLLSINTAVALWLGNLLGKDYYGFLVIASFYALTGIILFFVHPYIKTRINNSIITKIFN